MDGFNEELVFVVEAQAFELLVQIVEWNPRMHESAEAHVSS